MMVANVQEVDCGVKSTDDVNEEDEDDDATKTRSTSSIERSDDRNDQGPGSKERDWIHASRPQQ